MKQGTFEALIPENTAPAEAKAIALHSPTGRRLGAFSTGSLALPGLGRKRYRFGLISDLHLFEPEQEGDLMYGAVTKAHSEAAVKGALTYLQDRVEVDFLCIAGDLTHGNKDAEWQQYLQLIASHFPNAPVYPIAGNHDCSGAGMTDSRFRQYHGQDKGLLYTFHPKALVTDLSYEDDVFIMLSQGAWPSVSMGVKPFYDSTLDALEEALQQYSSNRCFVFLHPFPWEHSGDPFGHYKSNSWVGDQQERITSLMQAYPNSLWFHGHSHQSLEAQAHHPEASYDRHFGPHSIHVPSVSIPYSVTATERKLCPEASQGYVVEVYDSYVVLQAVDFVTGKSIPLGCYCLHTEGGGA